MLKVLATYTNDFLSLFYPEVCQACGEGLVASEEAVCTQCLYEMPYTHFHLQPDNPLARQFAGRVRVEGAVACFYFQQQSKVQQLVHKLKYHNRPQVGRRLGRLYGEQIAGWAAAQSIDLIIPVPLHPSREKSRGYNQSACFAEGLSEALAVPIDLKTLKRGLSTETQTSRHRFSRFENMQGAFYLTDGSALAGKHVLLVDDIITTGATIEACSLELIGIQGLRLSIAAIAFSS